MAKREDALIEKISTLIDSKIDHARRAARLEERRAITDAEIERVKEQKLDARINQIADGAVNRALRDRDKAKREADYAEKMARVEDAKLQRRIDAAAAQAVVDESRRDGSIGSVTLQDLNDLIQGILDHRQVGVQHSLRGLEVAGAENVGVHGVDAFVDGVDRVVAVAHEVSPLRSRPGAVTPDVPASTVAESTDATSTGVGVAGACQCAAPADTSEAGV